MLTEDEKLRSVILNLFKYIQKMREEIAQVHVRMDERTHFKSASKHLDEIVTATEKATNSILENLEEIDSGADQAETPQRCALKLIKRPWPRSNAARSKTSRGQRVGNIVKSLQFVEERIDAMVALWGREDIESVMEEIGMEIEMPEGDEALRNGPQLPGDSISQDDIDELFA